MTEDVYVFPTTAAQRRFWLLDQLKPGNPALNVPLAARLKGKIKPDVVERGVNAIVQRHEILRTSFQKVDEEVMQLVHSEGRVTLDRQDISGEPESEREDRIQRLLIEEGLRPFTLSQGPLLRGGLIKVREDEHILMLTMHHIGCDGWSNGILMREVAEHYTAIVSGATELPELALQYGDFALWQEEWLKSPDAAGHEEYWKMRLGGVLPVLTLPSDRPRIAGRTQAGTIHTLLLPKHLTKALLDLCHREDATPFMLFLSVYALLLYRYTGNAELIIGSPAANRAQADLEGVIGLFSNPLVLRLDCSGNPTFRELLGRVKDRSLEAFDHSAYPFEKVIEEIQPDPRRAGLQWLQTYFIYQKAFMQPQEMGEGRMEPLRSVSPGAMFEWSLGVLERAEGTRLQLEYNTELFDHLTIERVLHQFQQALEATLSDMNTRIDQFAIMTPTERKQVLADWNATRVDVPTHRCVHELFQEVASRTPSTIAVCDGDKSWTYQQLDSQSDQLARYLRNAGMNPDDWVCVRTNRYSANFAICFLAVLKAGGCCVILDTDCECLLADQPAGDNKLKMLIDCAEFPLRQVFPSVQTVRFSDDLGVNLPAMVQPNTTTTQTACIRYSSELSAKTNAVEFTHQALVSGAYGTMRDFRLTSNDRVGFALDEMLPTLFSGATLVCLRNDDGFDSENWLGWVREQRISVGGLATPAWHEMVRSFLSKPPTFPSTFRLMAIGGARISPNAVAVWRKAVGKNVRLLDCYQLEETIGPAGYCEMTESGGVSKHSIISKPAANTRLYLLDRNLEPVPMGVPGDLYIGGEVVASKCFSDGEQSEGQFIPDRYSGESGNGLRCTGDSGRFVGEGIELLGRRDDLDKTNGFRLEPNEILSILDENPAVWSAIVVPYEISGESKLIVYLTVNPIYQLKIQEVEDFVRKKLPAYMIPAAFIELPKFPLTRNGKLDWDALPKPVVVDRSDAWDNTAMPQTSTEQTLSDIWRELLGLERNIGRHENFFMLGGHSLAATRLLSRIRNAFDVALNLRTLLEQPTIEGMAIAVDSRLVEEIGEEEALRLLAEVEGRSPEPAKS